MTQVKLVAETFDGMGDDIAECQVPIFQDWTWTNMSSDILYSTRDGT